MAQQTISRLQRGTLGSAEFAVYDFSGGLNVRDIPQNLADNELVQALNGYIASGGGFRMRNGMTKYGSNPLTNYGCFGLKRFYQLVRNGAPTFAATTIGVIRDGPTTVNLKLQNAATGALIGTMTSTDFLKLNMLGMVRATDPNDPNYVAGNTDVLVIGSLAAPNSPWIWDGANLYQPAGWSGAKGSPYVAQVNGVVWFGGSVYAPNSVFGTGDGVVASFESLPGYNNFNFSSEVTGLTTIGSGATAALVVGMNRGIAVVYGTGPSNYTVSEIGMGGDGVVANGSFATDGEGYVYFLGRQAIYRFDGQNPPVAISQKIEPWVLNDAFIAGYPIQGNSSSDAYGAYAMRACYAWVQNNKYHLAYSADSTQTGFRTDTVLVYDLVLKGWTVLTPRPESYVGIGAIAPLDAPGDAMPPQYVCMPQNGGASYYNWDVEPTGGAVTTDVGTVIPVQFQTKYFKLGYPGTNKTLTRLYPEFLLSGPLTATMQVQTGYGMGLFQSTLANTPNAGSLWDSALWDVGFFSGAGAFSAFIAPQSRVDASVQGEDFSFGISVTSQCAPWVFGGLTGVYMQGGRT